jgi:uncharacterized protein YecT (DUF1311 family)
MLKLVVIIFTAMGGLLGQVSWAADGPIDKILDECITKKPTLSGVAACTLQSEKLWDVELMSKYNDLMKLLSDDEQTALRKSQKQWTHQRDAEIRLMQTIFSKVQAGISNPIQGIKKMGSITKDRVILLSNYIQMVESSKSASIE